MKELAVNRNNLNEETRKQGVVIGDEVYSLHITDREEVIITDFTDYTKIYCILTFDLYKVWFR